MSIDAFIKALEEKGISCKRQEPMKMHTTFHIGGNADVFVSVCSKEQLLTVINAAKAHDIEFMCIGNGSNLLVSDDGISGAVICLNAMKGIKVEGNTITAAAGEKLSAVCMAARDASLTGIEFAFGIPGSVGGALFMNAGAYGGEISQIVKSACVANEKGEVHIIEARDMKLGYRHSIFKEEKLYIISVTFQLKEGNREEITDRMNELTSKRKEKQPIDMPSAGSVFKRPEGFFAGALVEKNGFKGKGIGGAMVSPKHAGFIVNTGEATCSDVCRLIGEIQQRVYENDGVMLETEIMPIGKNLKR